MRFQPRAPRPAAFDSRRETLRVGKDSNIHKVAGAVTARMKGSDNATLIAIGPRAVNQAVKSFTIARQYLAADPDTAFDVVAKVGFGERGEEDQLESDPLCLLLSTAPRDQSFSVTTRPLRVSGASVPDRVAGAISSRVEENGSVSITAMGARSVFVAVEALALAQAALEQIDLETFCAHPLPRPSPAPGSAPHVRVPPRAVISEFENIDSEDGESATLLKFSLFSAAPGPAEDMQDE